MTRTIELNVKEAQDISMALTNEWAAAKKHLENIPLDNCCRAAYERKEQHLWKLLKKMNEVTIDLENSPA